MAKPLFYSLQPTEKLAGEFRLPDDTNSWPQHILQELYKQVPFITSYMPHVQMRSVDAERGYGLGCVEVQSMTSAPAGSSMDSLDAAGIRMVRIPFVIKDRMLSPFDLLVDDVGKVCPLTEDRLRQSMFRPQMFDVIGRAPGDVSIASQLYPSNKQQVGSEGSPVFSKIGSAATGLLASVLEGATNYDKQHFIDELTKEAGYLYAARPMSCLEFPGILDKILSTEPLQVKEASWRGVIPTNVMQVRRTEDGDYILKTASSSMWAPTETELHRGEVVERFGVKLALAIDTDGAVTVADGATATGGNIDTTLRIITEPGMYKVQDAHGKEHIGYAVPNLLDVDGREVPLTLFTNGSVVAVQGDIFGDRAGDGLSLPSGPVGKSGAFYKNTPDGIKMTVPLDIKSSSSVGGEPTEYKGATFDGRPVTFSVQHNIRNMVAVDGKILIPDDWAWLPLTGSETIALVSSDEVDALNVLDKAACVTIRGDGDSYSFEGTPLNKLASMDKSWLTVDDAMFLLAGLGVDQDYGVTKLAEAAAYRKPVHVKVGRFIEPLDTHIKEASEKASDVVSRVASLKQPLLLKEAAVIPDAASVEAVLSLGFINPENILTYISYLPDLESAQGKLCELLLGVRLGLSNVPVSSVERAVRSLEETIVGLKVLGFQGT